jgi:putative OPT family oligopeptide transporter
MVVGGLWTIFTLRSNLVSGIKEAIAGMKGGEVGEKKRTDLDLNFKRVFLIIGLLSIPIFIVYQWISGMLLLSGFMAIVAIIFAFIASAIAGYMAGLLGSSNNPISGVTISVLLFVSLLLLGFGVTGSQGMIIAIGIAAVICCAAAISGDVLQSMACGQMVGATPRRQQIMEIIGVLAAAPILAFVISILDKAYGGIGSPAIPAPQAFLMAGIVKGVLGGQMLWPYVLTGAVLAFVLILIGIPVLPVAIGIYLPFGLTTTIFVGGIVRYFTDKIIAKKYGTAEEEQISDWELAIKKTGVKPQEKAIRTGLLLSAGLIAGEALMGVIVAAIIVAGINLAVFTVEPHWPSLLVWGFVALLLGYIPLREILAEKTK